MHEPQAQLHYGAAVPVEVLSGSPLATLPQASQVAAAGQFLAAQASLAALGASVLSLSRALGLAVPGLGDTQASTTTSAPLPPQLPSAAGDGDDRTVEDRQSPATTLTAIAAQAAAPAASGNDSAAGPAKVSADGSAPPVAPGLQLLPVAPGLQLPPTALSAVPAATPGAILDSSTESSSAGSGAVVAAAPGEDAAAAHSEAPSFTDSGHLLDAGAAAHHTSSAVIPPLLPTVLPAHGLAGVAPAAAGTGGDSTARSRGGSMEHVGGPPTSGDGLGGPLASADTAGAFSSTSAPTAAATTLPPRPTAASTGGLPANRHVSTTSLLNLAAAVSEEPHVQLGGGHASLIPATAAAEIERLRSEVAALTAVRRKLTFENKRLGTEADERAKEITVLRQKLARAGVLA